MPSPSPWKFTGCQLLILGGSGAPANGEVGFGHGSGLGRFSMIWNEITNLVERARDGDRSAYGELVERFQPTVYALALARLRNPNEAQELVQEVFIHAMNKLGQLRDAHCFAGWLRQIAERMAINRLTRRGPVRGAEPAILENVQAAATSPLDELVRMEQKAQLWAGLDRL